MVEKKILKAAVNGMELLAKENDVTVLLTVCDPKTGWANELVCGNKEDVINTLGNLVCSVFTTLGEKDRQILLAFLTFVMENAKMLNDLR